MPYDAPSVKLSNVQGLRAYGALAVAFYHTGFSLGIGLGRPIGSFGVSIFFVISGFVMAMICDTNPKYFLVRRIARIVPLYWVLTLLVFLIAKASPGLLGGTVADGVSLLKSLFFVPYQSHEAYFPLLFLGWSLNYEMYFYLLIAAALMFHKRHAPLLAAVAMVAVLCGLRVLHAGGAAGFYAQPIIFEFVLGVLCYYGFRALPRERILAVRGWLGCAIAVSAATMLVAAITTIGLRNAVIVGLASTMLVFSAVLLDKVGLSVRWPILILLGDASYVVYLIHPYCEEALNKIVARGFPVFRTNTLIGMPVALGITLVLSIALYHFVDKPLHVLFRGLICRPAAEPVASVAVQRGL